MAGLKVLAKTSHKNSIGADTFRLKILENQPLRLDSLTLTLLCKVLEKMAKKTDPCQRQACRIQKCFADFNYQDSKCEHVIEEMKNCCRKFGDKSLCCEGFMEEIKKEGKQTKTPSKVSNIS